MTRALLIEDDAQAAAFTAKGLRESGITADVAGDGEDGYAAARDHDYDVLIVDRMLPRRDGLSVVADLRRAGVRTPVLFLSALDAVDDRVKGLRAGGDDYLCKPFAFAELVARVEALARRGDPDPRAGETVLRVGDLEIDLLARRVTRAGRSVDLQQREFQLLETLARSAGRVVTRTMLLESVWGYAFDPQTNVIDVHVSRLRRKIDRDFDRPLLHTVRGSGYRLADEAG